MTLDDLAAAMEIVANASPEDVMRLEMAKAVEGVNFAEEARPRPGPSMAGQSPINASLIEAKERSHAEMIARDRVDHERLEESRAKAAEVLSAGQSPENAYNVRRSVRAGR